MTTILFALYGIVTQGIIARFPEYGHTGWRNSTESLHGLYQHLHYPVREGVRAVHDGYPGASHRNMYVRNVGDLSRGSVKSKYVFFGDSFTEHLTSALYYVGMRHRVYFEIHFAYYCGFRAMNSLSEWAGGSSIYRCVDTLPLLWRHVDILGNDSVIVVANSWKEPVRGVFERNLIDLRDELKTRGKKLAVFAEPPGMDKEKEPYYPCADIRVLPLGRAVTKMLRKAFTGGRYCMNFDKGFRPDPVVETGRPVYEEIFRERLGDAMFFDLFKYMCRRDEERGGGRYWCRPPANLDGVVYDIGYRHDLAHLDEVGSDYVTDFVEGELFPKDNRLRDLESGWRTSHRRKVVL